MTAKLIELKEKMEAIQKEIKESGEAAVKELFKEFFDKNPQVVALRWQQYTPYFNDGDPCYFRVNEIRAGFLSGNPDLDKKFRYSPDETAEVAIDGKYEEVSFHDTGSFYETMPEVSDAVQRLNDVVVDDVFEAVFGDHAEVTATRDSIKVEEFSHD